mmetsp:Transcript_43386/g.111007  ORF Transcript_43386/g.111007 Transcript_43386/m.111007 type:complete len:199 (-) Transcript_43386:277-873(-)
MLPIAVQPGRRVKRTRRGRWMHADLAPILCLVVPALYFGIAVLELPARPSPAGGAQAGGHTSGAVPNTEVGALQDAPQLGHNAIAIDRSTLQRQRDQQHGRDCGRGVPEYSREVHCCVGGFWCADGSRVISCDCVNDDFCDCVDGSDEPGTSACSGKEVGFTCSDGTLISTVFVDDGVCDCCDGGDEAGVLMCQNHCT